MLNKYIKKLFIDGKHILFSIDCFYKEKKYTFPVWNADLTLKTPDILSDKKFSILPYIKIRNDTYNYFFYHDINSTIIFCNQCAINIFDKEELTCLCYHEIWNYFKKREKNKNQQSSDIFEADIFSIKHTSSAALLSALQKMEKLYSDIYVQQCIRDRIKNINNINKQLK